MLRKYSILTGLILSIILLWVAMYNYPGGSQYDLNSTGYDWKNNYLSNLFSPKAINGMDNASRAWAIGGMIFLCLSIVIFFMEFPKKIPLRNSAKIIQYFGISAMASTLLAVTPLHDTAVTIASTLGLVSMFYITVFVFKTKLFLCKILCIACLLISYTCNYIYYSGSYLEILPVMQKMHFLISIIWVLNLQYFTKTEDFIHIKTTSTKSQPSSS